MNEIACKSVCAWRMREKGSGTRMMGDDSDVAALRAPLLGAMHLAAIMGFPWDGPGSIDCCDIDISRASGRSSQPSFCALGKLRV